jgi:hypothetical protein
MQNGRLRFLQSHQKFNRFIFEAEKRFLPQMHTDKSVIKARCFFDNFLITVFIFFNPVSSAAKKTAFADFARIVNGRQRV